MQGAEGVEVDDGLIPADITRDSELAAHAADADAHHAPTPPYQLPKKVVEIEGAFVGGGWSDSETAQVSDSISSTRHTASAITGLTYVTFRTQPSPNSAANQYIAVRILLADKPKVLARQIRLTEGERDNPEPYDPNILLTAVDHVTDSGDYAYYSVLDADGFVSDDATWVQDIEPFHIDPSYVEEGDDNAFKGQAWTPNEDSLLGSTSSTTPYTLHNNNIRTVSSWGNSHAVGATTGGFYIPVRIPTAEKVRLGHYRLHSSRDNSYKSITNFVVDNAGYGLYNIFFPAGAATTITMEDRIDHVFDDDNYTINLPQLADVDALINDRFAYVEDGRLKFYPLIAGSSAVSVNGRTIDVDQTAFDALQLGSPESSHIYTFAANVKQVPTQVFNIQEDNIIKVSIEIANRWYSFSVPSAFLRLMATTAKPTGNAGADTITTSIDAAVLDCDGTDIFFMRASDNTLVVACSAAVTATIRIYEVGGVLGQGARQQIATSHAPRFWDGYYVAPVGTTPTLPLTFDGVVWGGNAGWVRPRPTSIPAGTELWFGSGEAYYNPTATFDWTTRNVEVHPVNDIRYATVPNPMQASEIQSTPPATGGFWQAYDAVTGWPPRWNPLSLDPAWAYLDRVRWQPNAANSTASIDFPTQDARDLEAITLWLNMYNAGGHSIWYRVPFPLDPLPNIQAAARGTVTINHINGGEMSWEHRAEQAEIIFSDFSRHGGVAQANYQKFGCNWQFQSRTPGGTSFDRIAFSTPAVYASSIVWELELWVKRKR